MTFDEWYVDMEFNPMIYGVLQAAWQAATLAKTMGREQMMAGKDYAALRAVHCVDWADMGAELAGMVREKCFELLGLPQAAIDSVCKRETSSEKAHEPAKRLRLAFWR